MDQRGPERTRRGPERTRLSSIQLYIGPAAEMKAFLTANDTCTKGEADASTCPQQALIAPSQQNDEAVGLPAQIEASPSPGHDMAAFLAQNRLAKYIAPLDATGVNSIDRLATLSDTELQNLGMKKGSRVKLRAELLKRNDIGNLDITVEEAFEKSSPQGANVSAPAKDLATISPKTATKDTTAGTATLGHSEHDNEMRTSVRIEGGKGVQALYPGAITNVNGSAGDQQGTHVDIDYADSDKEELVDARLVRRLQSVKTAVIADKPPAMVDEGVAVASPLQLHVHAQAKQRGKTKRQSLGATPSSSTFSSQLIAAVADDNISTLPSALLRAPAILAPPAPGPGDAPERPMAAQVSTRAVAAVSERAPVSPLVSLEAGESFARRMILSAATVFIKALGLTYWRSIYRQSDTYLRDLFVICV